MRRLFRLLVVGCLSLGLVAPLGGAGTLLANYIGVTFRYILGIGVGWTSVSRYTGRITLRGVSRSAGV